MQTKNYFSGAGCLLSLCVPAPNHPGPLCAKVLPAMCFEFGFWGFECRVSGFGFETLVSEFWVLEMLPHEGAAALLWEAIAKAP